MLSLVLVFLLGPLATAQADQTSAASLLRGHPPANPSVETRTEVAANFARFQDEWPPADWPSSEACTRYAGLLSATVAQLQSQLPSEQGHDDETISDDDFLRSVRTRLLIPAAFGLVRLYQEGSEGGFGTLDPRQKSACARDRTKTDAAFSELQGTLLTLQHDLIGLPGVEQWDAISSRLLQIADSEQHSRNRKSLALLASATVVSILFWEWAPPAAFAVVRQLPLSVSSVAESPALVYGARSLTLGAEGLGYYYLDRKMFPEGGLTNELGVGSYDEFLRAIEDLIHTPTNSAEVAYMMVGQIQTRLGQVLVAGGAP